MQMDPQRIFLSALMVLVFITQGRDFQDYLNEKLCKWEGGQSFPSEYNIYSFYFRKENREKRINIFLLCAKK